MDGIDVNTARANSPPQHTWSSAMKSVKSLSGSFPRTDGSSGGAENAWAAKTGGGGHREGKDQHVRTVDTGYAARRGKKSALSRQRG